MGLELFAQLTIEADTFSLGYKQYDRSKLLPLQGNAAYALMAYGEQALCDQMDADMDSSEALKFSAQLHAAVARLEQKYKSEKPEPTQGWSFDEALATIRGTAEWYQHVGELDCGVHARS